jgi:pyruvate carboxylase
VHAQRAAAAGLGARPVRRRAREGGRKGRPSHPGQIVAPFAGVVTLKVAEGDTVEAGQAVASIEAMKMEAAITAPVAGTVARLAIGAVQQVEGGDLLVVLR